MKKLFHLLALPALGICLAGCIKMGPDFQRPQMDFTIPGTFQQAGGDQAADKTASDRWWESFNNPQINALVAKVSLNNLDIRKSTAAVSELLARYGQARARRFPSLSGSGTAKKSSAMAAMPEFGTITNPATGNKIPILTGFASERTTANAYSLSLPASFEVDLWGRLSRADEAARSDLLQAEETRRTVVHSIVAEAVSLYLEMESIERRIAVNKLKIENFKTNLALVEKRYAAGLANALEIRQTRRSLTQARSVMPTLYQALGTVQHRLSVLAGRYPETALAATHPEDYYKQLTPVPTGLPSSLLERRPDIRSAEAALAAASARIGEAKANRFPSISLTGAYGTTSSELGDLFSSDSVFWNIGAGITGPIFDAGLRKAAHKAAIARYEQQVIAYTKTVLTAFAEVESALLARDQQLVRRKELLDYLEEARGVQEMATRRYEKGLADYINVLDAVISRFRAEEDIILSDLALMQNRVTLYRVMGGGWETAEEPEAPPSIPETKDPEENTQRISAGSRAAAPL